MAVPADSHGVAWTWQAMALGVNIQYSAELDPIDFTGVGVRAGTQLADVERAMLPKVTVPLIATQRLCLAAAQFDEVGVGDSRRARLETI
jgi:hypothetical protein